MRHAISILLVALLLGCGGEAPSLRQGEPTPAFTLEQLDGNTLRFPDDLRGKVVAIRFWADWCPFCETEMRDIEPLYQAHRDQGLVLLAINVRQERSRAAAFIGKLRVSYPVLLDRDGEVARAYGVLGLPTTFILDRQGHLRSRIIGESTPGVFARILGDLL